MRFRVEYHPKTAAELNRAVARYNDLRQGLGDGLRFEVYAAIDRILATRASSNHRTRSRNHSHSAAARAPGAGGGCRDHIWFASNVRSRNPR